MVFKFVIISDEVEDFKRVIRIDSDATFKEFNDAILDSVGYTHDQMTSFFICEDDWSKVSEVTLVDMGKDSDEDIYKEKQSACKPGSVSLPCGMASVIYLRLLSPTSSSGPPSDVGRATLIDAGLHDLTTPKMHSPICHHTAGGLLPHLLTLTMQSH